MIREDSLKRCYVSKDLKEVCEVSHEDCGGRVVRQREYERGQYGWNSRIGNGRVVGDNRSQR